MALIVRYPAAGAPVPTRRHLRFALALMLPFSAHGAEPVHLLGFVDELCPTENYCFELQVKPEFIDLVGARITVRFASANTIFDPENYELTLTQQNIVPGSHLRLLISADSIRGPGEYQANYIWIGD
ncbi:MAG: hypothetical protein [Olavius algarvensis Gamma 3 endosymbiont]|nr:MAG: hypothetical protein [Olavius algarvensis Gamma 3 endosymbiont]